MNEKPILFSGEMVRAILEERKTKTRRVITSLLGIGRITEFGRSTTPGYAYHFRDNRDHWHDVSEEFVLSRCPHGGPGDRRWVRESIRRRALGPLNLSGSGATYLADLTPVMGEGPAGSYLGRALVDWQWKRDVLPSIHMPRWASRITLEIATIGIQQVQDIMANPDDVQAEGLDIQSPTLGLFAFSMLWDRLNKKRGFGWNANPWVWVEEFIRTDNRH